MTNNRIGNLVYYAMAVAAWPITMLAGVGLIAVPGFLFYRTFFFLRDGVWLNSVCDLTTDVTWRGGNVPDACTAFATGWPGVDFLLHWSLHSIDASLFALLIAALSFGLMMLLAGVFAVLESI